MKYKYRISSLSVLLITISLLASSANASIISFKVDGSADSIDPSLLPYFNVGDEMALKFNVDLDVVGYENSWFSSNIQNSTMQFSVGTYEGSVSSYRPSITNGPNCAYICGDVWAAEAKNEFGTTFNLPHFDSYYLDIIQLEYIDDSGTALSTTNIAASIDELENFSNWHLALYFKDANNSGNTSVSIRTNTPRVTITAVPGPSMLSIFVLVLISLRLNRNV